MVRETVHVKLKFIRKVCVCLSKQHFAQCRLSISDAGSDWSSRLREERAGPQTVSGVQRILRLWVSLKLLGGCVRAVTKIND